MRALPFLMSIPFAITCLTSDLNARIVTLTKGGAKTNDVITIATNESISILSGSGNGHITVVKDDLTFDFGTVQAFNSIDSRFVSRVVIGGPATLSLSPNGSADTYNGLLTVEIQSDLSLPDKTLVLPQGSGANIILESSTNLVNWSTAAPGLYTNQTANVFFRIRAERVP